MRSLLDELKSRARDHRTCDVEVEGNVPMICYARTNSEEDDADREIKNLLASRERRPYETKDAPEELATF